MPLIDLSRYDTNISKSIPQADMSTSGESIAANALSNLTKGAHNLLSNVLIKQRENEVKTHVLDSFDGYKKEIKQMELDAASRTDSSGLVMRRNMDGTISNEPELDAVEKPLSYKNYIQKSLLDIKSKYNSTFVNDKDKFDAFSNVTRDFDSNVYLSGVMKHNEVILDGSKKKAAVKLNDSIGEVIKMDTPYFLAEADRVYKQWKEYADQTTGSIDKLAVEELDSKGKVDTGRVLARKSLEHASVSGSAESTRMLSEFAGANISFDQNQRRYVYQFIRDEYDPKFANQLITELERVRIFNTRKLYEAASVKSKEAGYESNIKFITESLDKLKDPSYGLFTNKETGELQIEMDTIDIDAEIEKENIPDSVKEELKIAVEEARQQQKNQFFGALPAIEQQQWIEQLLSIKFKGNANEAGAFNSQLKNLKSYNALRGKGGMRELQYTIGRLTELRNTEQGAQLSLEQWHDHVSEWAQNNMEAMIANDIIHQTPGSLRNTSKRVQEYVNLAYLTVVGDSADSREVLARRESGAAYKRPLELQAKKTEERLRAEFVSKPSLFMQKYGYGTEYAKMEKQALDMNISPEKRLEAQLFMNNFISDYAQRQGVLPNEERTTMGEGTVKQFRNTLDILKKTGNLQGMAEFLKSLNGFDPLYRKTLIEDAKASGKFSDAELGSIVIGMVGNEKGDITGMMDSIMGTDKRAQKEIDDIFGKRFKDSKELEKKTSSYRNDIAGIISTKLSAINSRRSKEASIMLQTMTDSIFMEAKARVVDNPSLKIEDVYEQLIESKITSKVVNVNLSPSTLFNRSYKTVGLFKAGSEESQIREAISNQTNSFEKDLKSGRLKIDIDSLPDSFKRFLGNDILLQNDEELKFQQLSKRFTLEIHADSVFGSGNTATAYLVDKNGYPTKLYLKDTSTGKASPMKFTGLGN